jgi:hypothetical protein
MMTPGDFASLLEGMEGLTTEDYIAWKLPYGSQSLHLELIADNPKEKKRIQKNSHSP